MIAFPDADEGQVDFSPDSLLCAFASNRDGKWHIYITNTTGKDPIRITDAKADHIRPAFSPDGSHIAFLSDRFNFGGIKDLWVHAVVSGEQFQVTTGVPVSDFCWLSDNETIVFSGGLDTLTIRTCNIRTKKRYLLMPSKEPKNFNELSPKTVRFQGVEKIIYVREYDNGDRRIHWVNTDGSGNRSIVNSLKRDWLE
jgi:dipeptidyl aminopeptidase/acylaminoacyl peptidase